MSDHFSSYVSVNERHTLANNPTLVDMGYVHMWVNHSRHFVNPDNGAHTQRIEGVWETRIKRHIKRMRGVPKKLAPPLLDEQLWRSWFMPSDATPAQRFKAFVTAVRRHHAP